MIASDSASVRKATLLAGLLFLAISTVLLFVGREWHDNLSRSTKEFWNLGHVAYFFVLVVMARRIGFLGSLATWMQWLVYSGGTLLLGVAIELIQMTPKIPVDWMDVWRDVVGGVVALLVTAKPDPGKHSCCNKPVLWLIPLLLLAVAFPALRALTDEMYARWTFPVLSDFSSPFELDRWDSRFPMRIVAAESLGAKSRVLRVDLDKALYAGFALHYMPRDWRGYSWLNLEILQPNDDNLSVTVRVHDLEHAKEPNAYAYSDRFNRSYRLEKGWNNLKIPLQDVKSAPFLRQMNLSQIANLSVFAVRLDRPWTLYLDKVYLSDQ
jgi:hypothetical protein